mgnify:CR=1 FL=1
MRGNLLSCYYNNRNNLKGGMAALTGPCYMAPISGANFGHSKNCNDVTHGQTRTKH